MTAAEWGILIPAVVAVLGAGAAYLKARSTSKTVQAHVTDKDQHP